MEVTVKNFSKVLPEIEEAIEKCVFLAIDTELTGLKYTDVKDNCYESVEDRYQVVRASAKKFLIIQFGLVAFFYDKENDVFLHKAYNFYTYPRQINRHAPNIRFLSEISSLDFLSSYGFDFNKLIYYGIPHLTLSGESKMREDLEQRVLDNAAEAEDQPDPISVPENMKKFLTDSQSTIKRFIASKKTEYSFDRLSPFQRKLIYNNIKPRYGKDVYFETLSDSDDDDELQVESKNSSSNKKTADAEHIDASSSEEETEELCVPRKPVKKINSHEKILRIKKVTDEELLSIEESKQQKKLKKIDQGVGFSKVIRKISQSGKIVVGHNMLLDVAHTITQFVDPLPDSLNDFKNMVQTCFPNIVDTKVMACQLPFRELMKSSVLFELVKQLRVDPFSFHDAKPVPGKKVKGYSLKCDKKHEAGYDAYITGVCFISMCQYVGTLQTPKQSRVLPESPLIMPYLNKLYMMRLLEVPYMNISGIDLTPSRSHVFHVSCPSTAKFKNIQDLFSPFGKIQCHWQNEKSLFVALVDKDQAPLVMRNIECEAEYKVVPFDTFKNSMCEKRPLRDSPPASQDSSPITIPPEPSSKSSPPTCGQKKRPKTERCESEKLNPVVTSPALFEQPPWD